MTKSIAQRSADKRKRKEDKGLKRVEVWAHPDDHFELKAMAQRMRMSRAIANLGKRK